MVNGETKTILTQHKQDNHMLVTILWVSLLGLVFFALQQEGNL